jgi:hypothetical protein
MANVRIDGLNQFTARLRTRAKDIDNSATEIAERAAEFGAARMREYIATRGTGYVGKGYRATPEGRIDTGQMYDDVGVSQVRHNPSGIAVNFGWVGDVESYYAAQEEGFTNPFTGRPVPPMHALLDATIETRQYFYSELRKRFK